MSGSDSEPTAASITCEVYGHEPLASICTVGSDIPVLVICERCGARWTAGFEPRKEPMSAPTIGRIVHYRAHGSKDGTHPQTCRPAIVTAVTGRNHLGETDEHFPLLHLTVFNPSGQFFNLCHHDDSDNPAGGTWHWPCAQGGREISR